MFKETLNHFRIRFDRFFLLIFVGVVGINRPGVRYIRDVFDERGRLYIVRVSIKYVDLHIRLVAFALV